MIYGVTPFEQHLERSNGVWVIDSTLTLALAKSLFKSLRLFLRTNSSVCEEFDYLNLH